MTIKVKEVIKGAARCLGIEKGVEAYLAGGENEQGGEDTQRLLFCFHRVEEELALDYLPLLVEEEIVTANGVVSYDALSRSVTRILCVEDEWGNPIKHRIYPTYCKAAAGRLKITYAYLPVKKEIEEESDYGGEVGERLLSYGVAAEFALSIGDPSTAEVWDKKYREAVRVAYKATPCKRIRARRWV